MSAHGGGPTQPTYHHHPSSELARSAYWMQTLSIVSLTAKSASTNTSSSDHFLRIHKIASSFTIQIRFRFNLHTWDVCVWLPHVITVVVLVVLVVALTCVFHESNVANQMCHFSSNNSIPARLLTRLLELSSPPSNSLVLLDGSAVSIRTS